VFLKNYNLIFFALFIVSIKWISSYFFFDEELSTKIIFESISDGEKFYPQIKYLSQMALSQSFDPDVTDLKNIPIPVSGIIFHAILFKFLSFYAFIILEFFAILIFLLLFYNIFIYFFSKNISVLFTILIYFIPLMSCQNLTLK